MTQGFSRRDAMAGAVAGATVLAVPTGASARPLPSTDIVVTTSGKVRGSQRGPIAQFLGIPYGADTRTTRFQAPVAPSPWNGVRECVVLGHQAPQMELGAADAPPLSNFVQDVVAAGKEGMEVGNEGEDCLVLNVWTPEASPAKRRPVMVWLHGGGFAIGSAGDPQYDGTNLARRGDVVMVGVNHRLNALGYLYLGDLDPLFADSGNAGQLDIVLALRWVRDNIHNFGGDPNNVTIFGESGGGAKVSTLLAMPPAHGLFNKAIIQSGPSLTGVKKAVAAAHAERTLARLGIAKNEVRKLLTLDYRTIIGAARLAQEPRSGPTLAPVVDGRSLPTDPFTPAAPAISRNVPVMIGTTKDEAVLFSIIDPAFGTLTDEQAAQRVAGMGPRAQTAWEAFKTLRPGDSPTYRYTSLATAQGTWINSIKLAERKLAQRGAPVFMFRLDWESPFQGGVLKSLHGLEVPLVFDNSDKRPLMIGNGPEPRRIAAVMSQAWIDFARNGDPSQSGLRWPAYSLERRDTMIFDVKSHVVSDPDGSARTALES